MTRAIILNDVLYMYVRPKGRCLPAFSDISLLIVKQQGTSEDLEFSVSDLDPVFLKTCWDGVNVLLLRHIIHDVPNILTLWIPPRRKISVHLCCLPFLSCGLCNIKRLPWQLTRLAGFLGGWRTVAPCGAGIIIVPWWEVHLMIDNHANGHMPSRYNRPQCCTVMLCKFGNLEHHLCAGRTVCLCVCTEKNKNRIRKSLTNTLIKGSNSENWEKNSDLTLWRFCRNKVRHRKCVMMCHEIELLNWYTVISNVGDGGFFLRRHSLWNSQH